MASEEPVCATSSRMHLVLKVKYEDTLRRITVSLDEDGSPDISLEALRSKIRELFNLSPNVRMLITYTDEDGDVVTMADDVDFLDAIQQGLNPLRLDVSLARRQPNPPRSSATVGERNDGLVATLDALRERNDGLVATLDALRQLSDPTCHLRRLAEIPAVNSVLSCPAVSNLMEGLIRVGTTHLGPLVEGVARTQGNNMNSSAV
uniref:TSA: Wollemia nobilis Ref_Wollemi_Transcript_13461_997 transcribed RNA sequence n=1 Tax=Wollemia nobilis TaxID=56998 RepID=A0A0C9S515_9CONI